MHRTKFVPCAGTFRTPVVVVVASAMLSVWPSDTPLGAQHTHSATGESAVAAAVETAPGSVPLMTRLGNWRRRIDTRLPLAQRYFDQGLRLYYAFNHKEALRAFREAQRLDPRCVMCVWGEAAALGPNINAPMDAQSEQQAIAATQRAVAMVRRAPVDAEERMWVNALAARYLGSTSLGRAARDSAYALAMGRLADATPNDPDAQALAAEAQMTLAPWSYWTRDGRPRPGTSRILRWLERGLRSAPQHPGLCHFQIHALEAAQPERAVACAERLAASMPGAGHIVHMPAHIYIRVGRWADAIEANRRAVHADDGYFDGPHTSDAAFYTAAYRSHNHHFLVLAASMAGASQVAIEASKHTVALVAHDAARSVPALQPMLAVPVQTLVTFGRWDDVLRTPLPPTDLRIATALTWYARGVAFAATHRLAEARATVDSVRSVAQSLEPGEARTVLDIAALAVEGEMALRHGDPSTAIDAFSRAAVLEDRLGYMEPPTWYYPIRHSLGKALLTAGKARDAEQAYRADLRRSPENVWSLRGLALALRAQGRGGDAESVERRLAKAMRLADVAVESSRY
ncbi:MAG: hypothetical protein IT359_14220 [Gemmatimonadaceae bacterium]|nr:hypothetical protein [Gemmatimonadaceae bacterium]